MTDDSMTVEPDVEVPADVEAAHAWADDHERAVIAETKAAAEERERHAKGEYRTVGVPSPRQRGRIRY